MCILTEWFLLLMDGFLSISAKHRTVLKTWQRPGKRNTGTAVTKFSQKRKTGTLFLHPNMSKHIKTIVGACCLLNFSCSACVSDGAGPLKPTTESGACGSMSRFHGSWCIVVLCWWSHLSCSFRFSVYREKEERRRRKMKKRERKREKDKEKR